MTDDCETEGSDVDGDRSEESAATEHPAPDGPAGEADAADETREADDETDSERPDGVESADRATGDPGSGATESGPHGTDTVDDDDGAERSGEDPVDDDGAERSEEDPVDDDGAERSEEDPVDDDGAGTPDGYAFERLPPEILPPDVQYTPEFDDDWVYPSGAKSGGTRDHTPVQGLELGVLGAADQLRTTVEAILHGLAVFYRYTGSYPRHRIVKSEESFERTADGDVGLVAVVQPRPDVHDGLIGHMDAMRADEAPGPEVLTPNRGAARKLVRILDVALRDSGADPIDDRQPDASTEGGWDAGRRIADTSIVERYAPLAADVLFDPTDDPVDLDGPGLDSIDQLAFEPHYLTPGSADGD